MCSYGHIILLDLSGFAEIVTTIGQEATIARTDCCSDQQNKGVRALRGYFAPPPPHEVKK